MWACQRELIAPAQVRPEELPKLPGCLILRPAPDQRLDVVEYGTPLSRIRVSPPGGPPLVMWFPGDALGAYRVEKKTRPVGGSWHSRALTMAGGGAWGCGSPDLVHRAEEGERQAACRFIPPAAPIEVLAPASVGVQFVRFSERDAPSVDLWVLADSVTAC